jgi:hypothetical protein
VRDFKYFDKLSKAKNVKTFGLQNGFQIENFRLKKIPKINLGFFDLILYNFIGF